MLPGASTEPLLSHPLLEAFRIVCRTHSLQNVWTRISWRALHQRWPQPTRQHDIVEYLTYLRAFLHPSITQCIWQARQHLDGFTRVIDSGSCWPLWIPTPLHALHPSTSCELSIQHLLDNWSAQQGLQGTVDVPGVLLIQINRFNQSVSGVNKSSIPVKVDTHIMVPGFVADLTQPHAMDVRYARYRCTAALLHEGQTPESGHYRTVLHREQQLLLTNDKVPASRLVTNQANLHYVHTSVYAAIYVRCPEE